MKEELKCIRSQMIELIQEQMENLSQVDYREFGGAIDVVKDISEALYYATVTKAMEEKDECQEAEEASKSCVSRKHYLKSKEKNMDKAVSFNYLNEYLEELIKEIEEIIKHASQEEKLLLQQKISSIPSKIV